MCGVPYHAAEGYIGKLIRKGFKVAICEQMEDPRQAKKLVRREVTRVVTPGTAADSSLGSDENNFLAALAHIGERVGFAALDLSTGEFRATEFFGEGALRRVQEELEQLRPKELLYGSAAPLFENTNTRALLDRAVDASIPALAAPSSPSHGVPVPPAQKHRSTTGSLFARPCHSTAGKSFWRFTSLEGFGLARPRLPLQPRAQFFTMSAPRSAARSITSTASDGTSARTASFSTPSPYEIWS